jgi:acetyl-CoA acyltransferase
MNEAVIVSALRTAVGKAPRGSLRTTRPDDMAAEVIRALMAQTPQLAPDAVDDVILGCATPEGESGTNVARIASLRAGLPDSVPAVTVNRFCSSGSQTIAMAAERIMAGMADQIIAGGTESMSLVRGNNRFRPNPYLVEHRPDAYLSMGLTAENVARKYKVSREDADAFALRSHQRALAAQQAGRFADDGIVPLDVEITETDESGQPKTRRFTFDTDEGPRADTTLEALAVMRELGLDESKVNVNGGAVALGHPLGASGAKLTVQLLGEMRRRGSRYGLVTMCVGGGQGAATIFENLQS